MRPPFDLARWQAGGTASFAETAFAPYWDELPSPPTIDASRFSHRQAVYKQLIASTGGEREWGAGAEHHPLWAYAAQLDWQRRSGRLSGGADADRISPTSWWGLMNYCFCICVLLGASEAGLVPPPRLAAGSEAPLASASVRGCVQAWAGFWRDDYAAFATWHDGWRDHPAGGAASTRRRRAELRRRREALQRQVWKAHTRTVELALTASTADFDLLRVMPAAERDFGVGWCRAVELLAAANWDTSLAAIRRDGAGYLPSAPLRDAGPAPGDRDDPGDDPSPPDRALSGGGEGARRGREVEREAATAAAMQQLASAPQWSLRLAALWLRRVARWRAARERMARTITNLTIEKRWVPLACMRLVALALAPRSVVEVVVVVAWLAAGSRVGLQV